MSKSTANRIKVTDTVIWCIYSYIVWIYYFVFTHELFGTSKAISEIRERDGEEWEREHLNISTLMCGNIDSCHKGASEPSTVSIKAGTGGKKRSIFSLLIKDVPPPSPLSTCESKLRNMWVKKKRKRKQRKKKKQLWDGGHRPSRRKSSVEISLELMCCIVICIPVSSPRTAQSTFFFHPFKCDDAQAQQRTWLYLGSLSLRVWLRNEERE